MASAKKHDSNITLQFGTANRTEIVWDEPKIYSGRVADALMKLTDAGNFGVHKAEFRPDIFARLEQAGVDVRFFMKNNCGCDGKRDFVRLASEWRIVPIVEMAA